MSFARDDIETTIMACIKWKPANNGSMSYLQCVKNYFGVLIIDICENKHSNYRSEHLTIIFEGQQLQFNNYLPATGHYFIDIIRAINL